MSAANRGKEGEALLQKHLALLNSAIDTAFYRMPDARSGSMKVALADFLMMRRGKLALIECKQVAHDFRLPHGNFDKAQVARQRIWKAAGCDSIVLIYHSTTGKWRGYDIDRFITREGGSWDLRDSPESTLAILLA